VVHNMKHTNASDLLTPGGSSVHGGEGIEEPLVEDAAAGGRLGGQVVVDGGRVGAVHGQDHAHRHLAHLRRAVLQRPAAELTIRRQDMSFQPMAAGHSI